jgi:hypothetical protein
MSAMISRLILGSLVAVGVACASLQAGRARGDVPATAPSTAGSADAPKFHAGRIDAAEIAECSGLVASRRHPGVFWAICDGGNAPALYALTRAGKRLATFPVDARNLDWEDIATDDAGHLLIAETGNNERKRRPAVVYQVDEPDPAKHRERAKPLPVLKTWRRDFPEPADCEALFIRKGMAYLIPKQRNGKPVTLYAFDLAGGPGPEPLQAVVTLPVRAPVTAADVSPDGKWLALLTVIGPYLFRIDGEGDVAAAGKAEQKSVFYVSPKMEAACFVNEGLLAATEERDVFLFRWRDFGIEGNDDHR